MFQDFLAKYQFLLQDADLMECAEMPGASLHDVDYKLNCAQEQGPDFMVNCLFFHRVHCSMISMKNSKSKVQNPMFVGPYFIDSTLEEAQDSEAMHEPFHRERTLPLAKGHPEFGSTDQI
jgi:hypothetical protein